MSEIRAGDILLGTTIQEPGMEPVEVARVEHIGDDRVLVIGSDGVRHTYDIDTVVELLSGHHQQAAVAALKFTSDEEDQRLLRKHDVTEPDVAPAVCILTGAGGENPDDCTTHGHEGIAATIIEVDGKPRSSCCRAELGITREVGPDTSVFDAEELLPAEGTMPPSLRVSYRKTYDAVDNGPFEVNCGKCGRGIDTSDIDIEET
jgi:hypothetical protein